LVALVRAIIAAAASGPYCSAICLVVEELALKRQGIRETARQQKKKVHSAQLESRGARRSKKRADPTPSPQRTTRSSKEKENLLGAAPKSHHDPDSLSVDG
jgi:hypothetical protein